MYTGFILSIPFKQKDENIDVHIYWVLYSQDFLELEIIKQFVVYV